MKRPGSTSAARAPNRYTQLLRHLFDLHYLKGASEVEFDREEIMASELIALFELEETEQGDRQGDGKALPACPAPRDVR